MIHIHIILFGTLVSAIIIMLLNLAYAFIVDDHEMKCLWRDGSYLKLLLIATTLLVIYLIVIKFTIQS